MFRPLACVLSILLIAVAVPASAGDADDSGREGLLEVVRRGYALTGTPPCRFRLVTEAGEADPGGPSRDVFVESVASIDGVIVSRIDRTEEGGAITVDDGKTRHVWYPDGGPVFRLPSAGLEDPVEIFASLEPLVRDVRAVTADGREVVEVVLANPLDPAGQGGMFCFPQSILQTARFDRATAEPIGGTLEFEYLSPSVRSLATCVLGFDPRSALPAEMTATSIYRYEEFETGVEFAADMFRPPADAEIVDVASERELFERLAALQTRRGIAARSVFRENSDGTP